MLPYRYCHQQRNRCPTVIRNVKLSFYVSALSENEGNPAEFWKTVNSLPHNSTSSFLCDAFNGHFSLIIMQLAGQTVHADVFFEAILRS